MPTPSRRSVLLLLALFAVGGLVWQSVQATRLGYRVERLRMRCRALEGRIASLTIELETSLSTRELAQQARSKLGMFPAPPETLRRLPESPAPAGPGTLLGRLLPRSWRHIAS